MSQSTIKESPILFSRPMVRAILDGRKTQTRRVVKPQLEFGVGRCPYSPTCWAVLADKGGGCSCKPVKPPYQPGMRLWVRETWAATDETINETPGVVYLATDPDWSSMEGFRWRPSIFMPRSASRITLQVTDVRVERVQAISEADAKAEGVTPLAIDVQPGHAFRERFRDLWDSINGNWNQNPWVWVVSFQRVL